MKQKLRDNTHIIIFSVAGLLWCVFLWWFSPKFLVACFVAYVVLRLYILWKYQDFVVTRIRCDYARNRCTLFSRFCRLEDVPLNAVEVRLRLALIPEELPIPAKLIHQYLNSRQVLLCKGNSVILLLGKKGIYFTVIGKTKYRQEFTIKPDSYIKFLEEIQCQKS